MFDTGVRANGIPSGGTAQEISSPGMTEVAPQGVVEGKWTQALADPAGGRGIVGKRGRLPHSDIITVVGLPFSTRRSSWVQVVAGGRIEPVLPDVGSTLVMEALGVVATDTDDQAVVVGVPLRLRSAKVLRGLVRRRELTAARSAGARRSRMNSAT